MTDKRAEDPKKRKWKPKFDFHVDYNDHFETPLVAYQDILPLLDALHDNIDRNDHIIYDPYYCDGRASVYLRQIGFEKVEHAKRDFYADVTKQQVPQHHTLITNPPYSDTHKEKCLQFCVDQFRTEKRPFFLLMPNYVAARSYYRRILGNEIQDVAYYVPSRPYEYDHPEGTGHGVSPFESLWFCGIGQTAIECFQKRGAADSFVASIEELEALKVIPTEKRPNPRQRKKRKLALLATTSNPVSRVEATKSNALSASPIGATKKRNKSKRTRHRDESGQRITKRF
jgi:hypothetical protein